MRRYRYTTTLVSILIALEMVAWRGVSSPVQAQTIGSGQIQIVGLTVDIDTRPDVVGLQSTRTAVKDFPAAVLTVVGVPGGSVGPLGLPANALVKAELRGPGLGNTSLTLATTPNAFLEIPPLRVAGDYVLSNVRLESNGEALLRRQQGPGVEAIVIKVIDEILVTEVTSRPLSLQEIEERGIVLTEENFTVFEFVVGFVVESEPVKINFPVTVPRQLISPDELPRVRLPRFTPKIQAVQIPHLDIPNLMVGGFSLIPPPAVVGEPEIPPGAIPGVIIIPGDVGFLNQFFSVLLMVSNAAPADSGLTVSNVQAEITLPPGGDNLLGTGDDPLRLAQTQQGVQSVLPILRVTTTATGERVVSPDENFLRGAQTGQAEFLLEGIQEGLHAFSIGVTGRLEGFRSGNSYPLATTVPGSVLVRNPNFALTIAHPEVVRDREPYTLYVTVTNTSQTDANLVRLRLDRRSLSGTQLAPGQEEVRSVDVIPAGNTETFAFRLISQVTGKVSATVFVSSDERLTGRFVLTVGVTEEGVPLSPDTLILPQTADFLPELLVPAALRLLGQAYSVATAPSGSLPPTIPRLSKDIVFGRALDLARGGLRRKFHDPENRVLQDLLFDYLGADLYEPQPAGSRGDIQAFDALRRKASAGHALADTFAQLLAPEVAAQGPLAFQQALAEMERYRAPHLSVAIGAGSGPAPVQVQITDAQGRRLGRLAAADPVQRDIPFADTLVFSQTSTAQNALALVALPEVTTYTIALRGTGAGTFDLGLVVPESATGQRLLTYTGQQIQAGSVGTLSIQTQGANTFLLELDTDGNGTPEATIAPTTNVPLPDHGPRLLVAGHWGQGNAPFLAPRLENGDPGGRVVVALFNEPLDPASGVALANYAIDGHRLGVAGLEAGGRLAFLFLREPMRPPPEPPLTSPFIPRTLTVTNLTDRRGNAQPSPQALRIIEDPEIGKGAVVSGTVRRADGTPVPFALVNYWHPFVAEGCPSAIFSQFNADAQGRYSLDFVLEGHCGPFSIEAQDQGTSDTGRIATNVQFDGQRLVLDVIIPGFGTVTGTVLDSAGTPVPGAVVRVQSLTPGQMVGRQGGAVADANGRYHVDRIAIGNIGVEAVNPADSAMGRVAGNITAAGTTATVDVTVFPAGTGTMRARVLAADGVTPIMGVPVVLFSGSGRPVPVALQTSDATGQVLFEGVRVGAFQLQATNLVTAQQATLTGAIDANTLQDVALVLPGVGGTVRGRVLDADRNPVAGAQVLAGRFLTHTDGNGEFVIAGLVVGSVDVTAGDPATGSVKRLTVTLTSATDTQEVTLVLPPPLDLINAFGTVFEADGVTTVRNTPVYCIALGVVASETDAVGNYRCNDIPVDLSRGGKVKVISTRGTLDGGEVRSAFSFSGETQNLDVIYRGVGSITGRVIQAQGSTPVLADVTIIKPVIVLLPLSGGGLSVISEQVRDVLAEAGMGSPVTKVPAFTSAMVFLKSDETVTVIGPDGQPAQELTGRFTLDNVLGGPFRVEVSNPFLGTAKVTGVIPTTPNPAERRIDVGDLAMAPATGEVAGCVSLADGITLVGENVRVTIRASGLPEFSVITAPDGCYAFPLVPIGTFTLRADTGVPQTLAPSGAEMVTDRFAALNVRLFGEAMGQLERAGEQVRMDIHLLDAGAIRVQVVANDGTRSVPFAKVTLTTASTLDKEEFVALNADANGELELFPVLEGDFTVKAQEPNSPAMGLAAGTMPRDPMNGYVLPITVQLGAVTSQGKVAQSRGFGTVTGTVFEPQGLALSRPAQVLLTASLVRPGLNAQGRSILERISLRLGTTTDTQGRFTLEAIPQGGFCLEAYEPFTARRGTTCGQVTADGETVVTNLTLAGLGRVVGTVFTFDGATPQPTLPIRLTPAGNFSTPIVSQTDAQGRFAFAGIPVGEFTVSATRATSPTTQLTGEFRGMVRIDGEVLQSDVFLEAAGTLQGMVLAHDGQTPVPHATVTLREGNNVRTTQASEVGLYQFASVPAGTFTLTAMQGRDGSTRRITLAPADVSTGSPVTVDLVFAGTGTVRGRVVDSLGLAGVEDAQIRLSSLSPFLRGFLTEATLSDGTFEFLDVPAGEVRLSVVAILQQPPLGTTGSGVVAPDTGLDLGDLRLQDAGSLSGRVLRPDGITPAADTVVLLRKPGLNLTAHTASDGRFALAGLPLGTYTVTVLDPVSTGRGMPPSVALTQNGQAIDLGTIVLDDTSPLVLAISPSGGQTDLAPDTPIVATFSEPVDPATVTDQTFLVSTAAGKVSGTLQVATVPSAITFTPASPFPDLSLMTVKLVAEKTGFDGRVTPGIKDAVGFTLLDDFTSHFTIKDATPPAISSQSPGAGATEVPLASVIRVAFNEPINRGSITAFEVRDGRGNVVDGTLNALPILNDTVVVFTPSTPLQTDTTYTITIQGLVTDRAGNPQLQPLTPWEFTTIDTRGPDILTLTSSGGIGLFQGDTITLTADVGAAVDVAFVDFSVNGVLLAQVRQAPFATGLTLTPALGSAVTVTAQATDRVGNRGDLRTLPLSVMVDQPPTVAILAPPANTTVPSGRVVPVTAQAVDDVGVASIALSATTGATTMNAQEMIARSAVQVDHTFSIVVPAATPPGTTLHLSSSAQDTRGQPSPTATRDLVVTDGTPPTVVINSPVPGTLVDPGTPIVVQVSATDNGTLARLAFATTGALVTTQARNVAAAPSATVPFTFDVPEAAAAGETITITATATDTATPANTGSSTPVTVVVRDTVRPVVTALRTSTGALTGGLGQTLGIIAEATDAIGVSRLTLETTLGTVSPASRTFGPGNTTVSAPFTLRVPNDVTLLGSAITLTTRAFDIAGNSSDPPGTLTITVADQTAPTVSIVSPAPQTQVTPGQEVVVEVSASDNVGVTSLRLRVPAASFEETLLIPAEPETRRQFRFTVPATAAAHLPIVVTALARDEAGNTREDFLTLRVADTSPPTVMATAPVDGATGVSSRPTVRVTFSKALAPLTVNPTTVFLTPDGGTQVPAEVTLEPGDRTVTLVPTGDLGFATLHHLTLSTGITDVVGNALAASVTVDFTTASPDATPPRVVRVLPSNGAMGVSITTSIQVRFSESIDRDTINTTSFSIRAGDTLVPGVFRFLGGDTTVHFTPVASLPFATPITWQLTAAITDVAGNALVDANGNPLTQPLIFTFTTGNFVITQPVDGGNVVENRRLLLEARGDAALPIATVTFTVGGQVLPTVSGPPFTTVIVTPRAPTSLTITAVARSSTGAELVRHEVVVNVVVGLEIQPRLVGLQLGGMATLRLELSSALSTDLTVDLHAADPAVVLLPATAEIPTGQTVVPVTALGGASGSTTVLASSSLDTAASIVSVRESMPPQQLQVFTPAAGLMVVPALSVGQVVMPGSGRQTLTVRLLASPAAADTQMVVTSSNPAIANVTGPVSILAGTRVAALTLVTGQTGEAVLVLRAGPEVRQLTVFVGEPPTLRLPLALAASVGLAVLPPLPVGQVIVPTVGSQPPLTVRLLSNPAPQAMPVTVRSSNPDVADVVRPVTVPTGSQVAELTLVTREVGKATVTLQTDTEVFGLTIFVETSPEGQLLPIIAPTVGVEVAP